VKFAPSVGHFKKVFFLLSTFPLIHIFSVIAILAQRALCNTVCCHPVLPPLYEDSNVHTYWALPNVVREHTYFRCYHISIESGMNE
jgi:hypothetical protein